MTASVRSAADARLGNVVADKYRVERLLGSGGMGSVYEATHVQLGKRVALKFLHMSAAKDETALSRFQREARVISAVQSAHVVQVFDWGQERDGPHGAGQPFLVMELLNGTDLSARIKQLGRLAVPDAIRFTIEALRGLRKVHNAGIVHRDLKPENLFLITADNDALQVKIVDFGLSKLVDEDGSAIQADSRLTLQGAVIGTPLYMSPEQVEAVEEIDGRTDLWAMGTILYEMLAGSPPFMDRSYARLVMAICQQDPPDLRRINDAVPRGLCHVIAHAMRRDRSHRYPTAEAFIDGLERVQLEANKPQASGKSSPRTLQSFQAIPMAIPTAIPSAPAPNANANAAVSSAARPTADPAAVPGDGSPPPHAPPRALTPVPDGGSDAGPLDATIAAHTRGAATVWLSDAPVFSIWRGDVDSPDRLRIEARDGSVRDLRLTPVGELKLGRGEQVGNERNDLVYADVASRLAAKLHHDGARWWLERRTECSVPVQVGTRTLERGERAPLVHGSFVTVGAMHATMVDRRYVSRSVPSGTVDPTSGLLARGGLEQEVATALQQEDSYSLVLLSLGPPASQHGGAPPAIPETVRVSVALHQRWPSAPVARDDDTIALLLPSGEAENAASSAHDLAAELGARVLASGHWVLQGEAANAGSEVEIALNVVEAAAGPGGAAAPTRAAALRGATQAFRMSLVDDVLEQARHPKRQMLLFGIEEQHSLSSIGPQVVTALEQELAAIIATQAGPSALVTRLADGVVAACIPRKIVAARLGVQVQCDWHARPPITDGKVELPRTLSWEEVVGDTAQQRATELARECADPHGVLSALSGGLPYPIAGRVHAAISASSAVERVKMLFDVLEGTWRFIAVVLAAAYFAKADQDAEHASVRSYHDRVKTRAGLPLGNWRELARICAKSFEGKRDLIGRLAAELLGVKLTPNQTFDTLSNLMHAERNQFAHGHYSEAKATGDVAEFEQMTRTFLRALRPLCAWTLVTVQRTEPDLYGESQTVEFIDHTGPYATGARRRIGFTSPVRLANVVYLARWRDGLVLPLEPFVRRLVNDDRFGLYWMDHLPRAGTCGMTEVVSGESVQSACDLRRLPPLLRQLAAAP